MGETTDKLRRVEKIEDRIDVCGSEWNLRCFHHIWIIVMELKSLK